MRQLFKEEFQGGLPGAEQGGAQFRTEYPPLINAYMGLSPSMRFFGTSINDEFGDVEESGILIEINQILEEKKQRHIESYIKSKPSRRFLLGLRQAISGKARKR